MSKPAVAARWNLVGHRRAVNLLREAVATGQVSHAYLIGGPRQVGKTTLALTLAAALNCAAEVPPCGECRDCRRIAKGLHPDVRLLKLEQGESDGQGGESSPSGGRRGRVKTISMDEVRAVLRDAVLAPFEGRWKVYIIRYAEDLSLEAIQTLLKTLEEPPAHVVLTLTTVDDKILPLTVISRCQQVKLGLAGIAEIEQALTARYGADAEQARLLAHLSGGRVGWALNALANPKAVAARAQRLSALLELSQAGRVERLAYAEQLAAEFAREPEGTAGVLELWLSWWRDVLLTQSGAADRVINYDRQQELRAHAARFHAAQLVSVMQGIRTTLRQLQQNVNPRLALEVLMLSVP